jgi:NAD(P)-dependent dehydrogenase (short-subunit alcohol dehydrogenase family)
MRAVVVGASSGLGRCIGIGLAQRGARVALLARRHDRLVEAAEEAGNGALAIRCDVTQESSSRAAVDEAADGLGGIDALVYASGIAPLARLADIDATTWRRAFDTNVIGASLITAAAVPHLTESHGTAVYLASHSASLTPPWPGLAAYSVSKAALDRLVDSWRAEHPSVGFTRVIVGECLGGEGASAVELGHEWDPEVLKDVGTLWAERNLLSDTFVDVEEVTSVVDTVLRAGSTASVPFVAVLPRPPT